MGNVSASRLKGDDYQHLFSWYQLLDLLKHPEGTYAILENQGAGAVDDLTMHFPDETHDYYYQIKFHVDHRDQYSLDGLINGNTNYKALLPRFWTSWSRLKARKPNGAIELILYSFWSADSDLGALISSSTEGFKEDFFSGRNEKVSTLKESIQVLSSSDIDDEEFSAFARSLRFKLGMSSTKELTERVKERMEHYGLKTEGKDLLAVVGQVRAWITEDGVRITKAEMESVINKLALENLNEKFTEVHFYTVICPPNLKERYLINWFDYFVPEGPGKSGHELKDPTQWNEQLAQELVGLKSQLLVNSDARVIKARGYSRLSPWFAFGHTFSKVAGFDIEVDQNGSLWRTDATPNPSFNIVKTETTITSQHTVEMAAVAISISSSIREDVASYLKMQNIDIPVLFLESEAGIGLGAISSDRDLIALADQTRDAVRSLRRKYSTKQIMLFYCGPFSGACFIGNRLNACGEIQIMEDTGSGYTPSFLLK